MKRTIEIDTETIPDLEGEAWDAYCATKGWSPLNSTRRAWISEISTYLRGADTALYFDGTLIDVVDAGEMGWT